MAAPPCPVCCENTRGAAATTVAAAPVFSILRLIGSIIVSRARAGSSALDDLVGLLNLWFRFDSHLAENREKCFAKAIQRLLRIEDIDHLEVVTRSIANVMKPAGQSAGAGLLQSAEHRLVLLSRPA